MNIERLGEHKAFSLEPIVSEALFLDLVLPLLRSLRSILVNTFSFPRTSTISLVEILSKVGDRQVAVHSFRSTLVNRFFFLLFIFILFYQIPRTLLKNGLLLD